MIYQANILKFFFPIDDHLYRLHKAESLKNHWKISALLVFFSVIVYTWMALLGIGSDIVSGDATAFTTLQYEESKFWFVLGRMGFAISFALLVLFLPTYLFYLITKIPYRKLLIMQQIVFFVMLIERITWIPFVVYLGLDWYVSPLSFGIITSYFTEIPWVVFFFGATSLFQLWIIWFQAKSLSYLSGGNKRWIWFSVITLHIIYWAAAALLAFMDIDFVSGWYE